MQMVKDPAGRELELSLQLAEESTNPDNARADSFDIRNFASGIFPIRRALIEGWKGTVWSPSNAAVTRP